MGFLRDLIALIIFVVDIWAILNVARSNAEIPKKIIWILVVAVLPVLGLIVWAFAGPRSQARS